MDKQELTKLLNSVAAGSVTPDEAALQLKLEPFHEVGGYARVDFHRGIRQGVPEVIYVEGKTKEHILGIARTMLEKRPEHGAHNPALAGEGGLYRAGAAHRLQRAGPHRPARQDAGALRHGQDPGRHGRHERHPRRGGGRRHGRGPRQRGAAPLRRRVSGIHRLLGNMEYVMSARVIIAVAGMEARCPRS